MSIAGIQAYQAQLAPMATGPAAVGAPREAGASVATEFASRLSTAVEGVNDQQLAADAALRALGAGGDVDLHGAMIALEQADISLRAMVAVRDKFVGAYEQIMNMTI